MIQLCFKKDETDKYKSNRGVKRKLNMYPTVNYTAVTSELVKFCVLKNVKKKKKRKKKNSRVTDIGKKSMKQ